MHNLKAVTGTLRDTPRQHLEKWLGAEPVESMSRNAQNFYWPIPVHGVPGAVYAMPGGGFVGRADVGSEASAYDRAADALRRYRNSQRARIAQHRMGQIDMQRHDHQRHMAFASVDALVSAATGGKAQSMFFAKTGAASNAIGNANDLFYRSGQPTAGSAASAAPTGTSPTSASVGALPWANPVNANTGHFASGWLTASVVNNTLLLYDRLFASAKTMNSTATEAVTGTFSRYQNATATATDYVGGNFVFPANPTTVLAATAHNWTVCQYTNQAGTTAQSIPSIAGVSACVVGGIDLVASTPGWFMPLASGDVGVKALTQMQCSALVATGTIDFVVGHPIAFMPCAIANMVCPMDGLYTALNLTSIFNNACLSFIEMPKPATTATNYSGQVTAVAE